MSTTSTRPSADTDALARMVAGGDREAFAVLYDALSPEVYGIIRQVLRDPALSEEVAQEVLVEVWRSATRFDRSKGSARSWVLTIARRRAIDRIRSEQASRDRDQRYFRRHADRHFDVVVAEVEHRLEAEAVRQALTHLTAVQRQAIEMAYYGGYTCKEVARLLHTPVSTVKTRVRDGLIRLRDAMDAPR